jgi:peptidoglycan/LPS O-acetylase OafA/YrhL
MVTEGVSESFSSSINGDSPMRLYQIDGLRGIAMTFVFIGHFASLWA